MHLAWTAAPTGGGAGSSSRPVRHHAVRREGLQESVSAVIGMHATGRRAIRHRAMNATPSARCPAWAPRPNEVLNGSTHPAFASGGRVCLTCPCPLTTLRNPSPARGPWRRPERRRHPGRREPPGPGGVHRGAVLAPGSPRCTRIGKATTPPVDPTACNPKWRPADTGLASRSKHLAWLGGISGAAPVPLARTAVRETGSAHRVSCCGLRPVP